jgi:hypothetical protein
MIKALFDTKKVNERFEAGLGGAHQLLRRQRQEGSILMSAWAKVCEPI